MDSRAWHAHWLDELMMRVVMSRLMVADLIHVRDHVLVVHVVICVDVVAFTVVLVKFVARRDQNRVLHEVGLLA